MDSRWSDYEFLDARSGSAVFWNFHKQIVKWCPPPASPPSHSSFPDSSFPSDLDTYTAQGNHALRTQLARRVVSSVREYTHNFK